MEGPIPSGGSVRRGGNHGLRKHVHFVCERIVVAITSRAILARGPRAASREGTIVITLKVHGICGPNEQRSMVLSQEVSERWTMRDLMEAREEYYEAIIVRARWPDFKEMTRAQTTNGKSFSRRSRSQQNQISETCIHRCPHSTWDASRLFWTRHTGTG